MLLIFLVNTQYFLKQSQPKIIFIDSKKTSSIRECTKSMDVSTKIIVLKYHNSKIKVKRKVKRKIRKKQISNLWNQF